MTSGGRPPAPDWPGAAAGPGDTPAPVGRAPGPAGTGTPASQAVGQRAAGYGRVGLAAIAASILATFAVAVLGPSVMEPALPGRAGQPPWSAALHPPAGLVVALTAVALAAGTAGLCLCLLAGRRGWLAPPRLLLAAGLLAAAALTLVPPFGSSDHLSYAAYGRMAVTGHDPYTTTPAALAALGDPVARAVQDWRGSPSVYGSLATGGQALASVVGGNSARLTVFVLSVLGTLAFAGTALLLFLLTRGSRAGQSRAALLWACNPLLLQVLVAGAHVDSQAVFFAVAAVAAACLGLRAAGTTARCAAFAGAGVAAGLGVAVKLSMALAVAGLAVTVVLAWQRDRDARAAAVAGGGLLAGFAVTAAAAFIPWGLTSLRPALRAGSYVSIGSPWRTVRLLLSLGAGEGTAGQLVKVGALVLAVALAALFARPLLGLARGEAPPVVLAAAPLLAVGVAWLIAWPYVLPWYDSLAWAALALLPWLPAPWAALDWLVLARGAALALGYLPARGIVMPPGLRWLETVVRTGVTPVVLLAVTVALAVLLWRHQRSPAAGAVPR
jgi:hypothetical protein